MSSGICKVLFQLLAGDLGWQDADILIMHYLVIELVAGLNRRIEEKGARRNPGVRPELIFIKT